VYIISTQRVLRSRREGDGARELDFLDGNLGVGQLRAYERTLWGLRGQGRQVVTSDHDSVVDLVGG
jgi:hypothetical protein